VTGEGGGGALLPIDQLTIQPLAAPVDGADDEAEQ
jgi:hypothetical protein